MKLKFRFKAICLLLFCVMISSVTVSHASRKDYPRWMTELDDNILLRDLSIPGTHDTFSRNTVIPSANCHKMKFDEQLKAGLRAFDVRVDVEAANAHIGLFHGPIAMIGTFKTSVHERLKDFLHKNPGECIFLFIKHETAGNRASNKGNLKYFMQKIVGNSSTYINTTPAHLNTMRLGDIRSKVIVVDRSDLTHKGVNYDSDLFLTKDSYEFSSVSDGVKTKLKQIRERFSNYNFKRPDKGFLLTYLSFTDKNTTKFENVMGFKKTFTPEDAAKEMNPRFYKYLINEFRGAYTGIVLMDYPDQHSNTNLIGKIISYNWSKYKYRMKIKTADLRDAGTDANVFIRIHGTKDHWDMEPKFGIGYDAFEQNAINDIIFGIPSDIGDIKQISVSFDRAGRKSGWCLEYIKIEDPFGYKLPLMFNFNNQWFYSANKWTTVKPTIDRHYYLKIKTANIRDAGTDANVYIQLTGTNNRSYTFRPKDKGIPGDAYEQGQTDSLSFVMDRDIGPVTSMTVWFEKSGRKSGWCLEYVDLRSPETNGQYIRYKFNPGSGGQWFYSTNVKHTVKKPVSRRR